jgi:predicted transcriptional regulator
MMKVNGQWINLSALQVKEDPQAQIANDGTVTLNSAISNLTLEFTTLTNVQSIRLDVNKTEDSKTQWIREIIPGFTGTFKNNILIGSNLY